MEISCGDIVANVDSYRYGEGSTLKFMGYTCGTVEWLCERTQDNIKGCNESILETLVEDVEEQIEGLRRLNGKFNFSKAMGVEIFDVIKDLIENAAWEIHDKSDDAIGEYCGDFKEHITYPWRDAAVDAMNHGYCEGAVDAALALEEQGLDGDIEEKIEERVEERIDDEVENRVKDEIKEVKKDVFEVVSDKEEYDYWVQWNRDMGFVYPELAANCVHDPSQLSFFDEIENAMEV
jgi:hypothetical protein